MEALGSVDIGSMLRSTGPVVKCVLLRAAGAEDEQKKPAAATTTNDDGASASPEQEDGKKKAAADEGGGDGQPQAQPSQPPILTDLIEEIEIDTTPKKAMVQHVLGGPFTFLGQYEDEGIMVMVRRPDFADDDDDDDDSEDDHSDEDQEDGENKPPLNMHRLQPPLHKKEVYGDILLMRVAPVNDEPEEDEEQEEEAEADADDEEQEEEEQEEESDEATAAAAAAEAAAAASAVSNDDFFLDYTRAEYLKFAARTDIPEHEIDDGEDEEEEIDGEEASDDDEEGSDEEFGLEDLCDDDDEDEDDEDAQVGMMNLIFGQILRRFREENGRGPDTRELLEMRSALAERLGVEVPPVDDEGSDWDKKAPPFASPGPKLGGTPRKQPGDADDNSNDGGEEEKKADGDEDADKAAAAVIATNDEDADAAEPNDDEPACSPAEKRGEKRTGDEAFGGAGGTPATASAEDDSDGDNSEERARKRVKFVPKEDHTVHVVERIDHGHSDNDDESSDDDEEEEEYVEDAAGADDVKEGVEQEGDALVEVGI